MVLVLSMGAASAAAGQSVVQPVLRTAPLFNYEDAPATPDADDPAIWINRRNHKQSLIIGTAKDAGLLVYDLSGQLVQAMFPPNAPQVTAADPATPAGLTPGSTPCVDSVSGETFGRYNNVDIAYDVRLGTGPSAPRADVAIVSDRGCDRVRFFKIDLADPDGPLVDITSPNVPRVFPRRYEQPSERQPSGAAEGWVENPVDDQNTVYGLTVVQGRSPDVFVTERERGLVRQLSVVQRRTVLSRIVSFVRSSSIRASTSATNTAFATTGLPAAKPHSKSRSQKGLSSTASTTRCMSRSRRSVATGCRAYLHSPAW
jgi:3-phytase